MAARERERVFGTVKIGPHGNSTGLALPKDLRQEAQRYDNIPSQRGDEVEFLLVENRETGDAELKLAKKED